MAVSRSQAPAWFWTLAILLLLWEAIGVFACIAQLRMGAASWPAGMEYDRRIYLAMPFWYNWVYVVATFGGLAGAVALLARKAVAVPLNIVSVIAIVIMFGYVLGMTDMIAHKGFGAAAGFPIVIFLLGLLGVWLARTARDRAWVR